jgi:UDP-4-amino-4-deoxy-L-arabinose formyltransferase / UDP-glucuronic acid dehydrogenase (UDP-4-keto-hexauronic acid decarboxylating)
MHQPRPSLIVCGIGTIAELLVEHVLADARLELAMAVGTAEQAYGGLRQLCAAHRINYAWQPDLNEPAFVQRVRELRPTYVISADNQQIFGEALLSSATQHCINFHLGLLSRYRGSNLPSWVIWNEESEHGVCWHTMTSRVDGGLVVCDAEFVLDADETAYSLTIKCIEAGIGLIPELVSKLAEQPLPTRASPIAPRFYRKRDLPNGGYIEPAWSDPERARLIRALDYGPIPGTPGPARSA